MSRGIPKASAQWTCAKAGGFEIIASAAKVRPVRGHGEWQESQQPLIIFENDQLGFIIGKWCVWMTLVNISRFFKISPFVNDSNPGINPGSRYFMRQKKDVERIEPTFHHVTHEVLWISADTKELQTCTCYKFLKGPMSGNSDTMPVFDKLLSKRNVWLYVT